MPSMTAPRTRNTVPVTTLVVVTLSAGPKPWSRKAAMGDTRVARSAGGTDDAMVTTTPTTTATTTVRAATTVADDGRRPPKAASSA
jgi:hypothetical protein